MRYGRTFKLTMMGIAIVLLLIIALSLTPVGAIRLYIAVHGDLPDAVRVTIHQGGFFEHSRWSDAYGWQFFVDGWYNVYRQHLYFIYLNRNSLGLWSVTSAGTGS
jgi:hypothetical protein